MRFLIAFLAIIAATQAFLPLTSSFVQLPQQPTLNGTLEDLGDYFNGVWGYFNLTQEEAIQCFTTQVQANTYFQILQALYQVLYDYSQGNRVNFIADMANFNYLTLTINSTFNCLYETDDWANLYIAAGYNLTNMTLFNELSNLYFGAHGWDYYTAFTPVYEALNNGDYSEGGDLFGGVLEQQATNSSAYYGYYMALEDWDNNLFFFFNLTVPEELPTCYTPETAQTELDFFVAWSGVVAASNAENVVNNTQEFFQGTGGQLLQQMAPISECEDETSDQERLNTALGIDLHSQDFYEAIGTYINNNPNTYLLLFTQMYEAFGGVNIGHAADYWAAFVQLVVASINE